METQDHKKPKPPGHEGHSGGVHICNKCGWPFPKSHPSAKHRRAHKKVCGTVEGYRLDNDAQNKTNLMDGSDGEHVSDNESKTPSVKVVERTISRRSSSGVGSRSSRSTRSEDDVFTDAVTDFTDSQGHVEAPDGGIQRFYSMQSVTDNDLDDMKHAAENAIADNLCSPDVLFKDNKDHGQNVETLEGNIDREDSSFTSQDLNSYSASGPGLIPTSITIGLDNKVDTSDESKDIVSSKKLELNTTCKDTAEGASEAVSALKTADEAILDPSCAGEEVKPIGMESTGCKDGIHRSEGVDAPGTSHPIDHSVGVNDPANEIMSKSSDVIENHGSLTGAYEAVPDNLALRQQPEIAIEELDHTGQETNRLEVTDSVTETGDSKNDINYAAEDVNAGIDLKAGDSKNDSTNAAKDINAGIGPEPADSKKVSSEDDVLESAGIMENELKQDVEPKTISDKSTSGEPAPKPDVVEASDTDINKLKTEVVEDFKPENLEDEKVSCAEEEKPIVSLGGVFPEGASTDAVDNLDITCGTANTCDSVKNNTEHVILQEADESEVSRKELSGSSLLADLAVRSIPPQVTELSNVHDINDTGNDGNMGVLQTHFDGNEMSRGQDNEAVTVENAPGCDLNTVGSSDSIHEPLKSEKICEHDNSDKRVGSGDVTVGLSSSMVDNTVGSSAQIECTGEDGTGAKTDNIPGSITKLIPSDSLEVCEDAQQHLQSSASVEDTSTKKFADEASGATEGDRTIRQHVAVSACDVLPDSSSLTDSLEGNWGSISVDDAVMSAISDTPPATPPTEENASLELKPVMENQHREIKTSGEPQVGIETKEGASEIETLEEHQQKSSVLQTALSSSVAHADNAPHGGKRNEEIVSKVTNWSANTHHTPLKTLLGEATARSRAESPIHHQMKLQTDDIPVANNGFSKTENVVFSSNVTTSEASKEEMGKEWNSPARYPVNIKTEKRKPKSRPYWAPFLCCSSVNAR